MNLLKAVIFDLDGTLLDNNNYHLQSWKKFLQQMGMHISDADYKANISGRTNHDATEHVFGRKMTKDEAAGFYLEKERIYREMYEPDIKPVNGLLDLLQALKQHHIKMAIATSGIQVNIDFMFRHVPIQDYFEKVINSSHIENGKPDPEIFLTTATALKTEPADCIVFEDSTAGVQAGKAAGMRVVALTTTHRQQELNNADLIIDDYTQVAIQDLAALMKA